MKLQESINRLIQSGLSVEQMTDLKNILQEFGDQLSAANACTENAIKAQELTELILSPVQAPLQ